MKAERWILGGVALLATLFITTSAAQADEWWHLDCPANSRLQISGGNMRCMMNSGGANAAPQCPGDYKLEIRAGADVCSKGGHAAATAPVKCKGDKWSLLVDHAGGQDQCRKVNDKGEERIKNAKCGDGFAYKLQPGNDTCTRAEKPAKTAQYKCAVGHPNVDSEGPNDRCIKVGTISYIQPSLSLIGSR